jgi:hypothetical protein
VCCGPGSSVVIQGDYGLDGPGIESRWMRDFPPVQTGPPVHPASCTMGTGSFPGVKCGRGVTLTTHPLLAPRSWKSRAYTFTPVWATTGPVTGLLRLYFAFYICVYCCRWILKYSHLKRRRFCHVLEGNIKAGPNGSVVRRG